MQKAHSPSTNKWITSVSEATQRLKQHIESAFRLTFIHGEVSELSTPQSGHIYFTLKDSESQIQCFLYKSQRMQIPHVHLLKVGASITIKASLSVYTARGSVQARVENFRLCGEGLLREQFLILKKKCAAEGLFHPQYKKKLPPYPKHIAVISSKEAAGLQDLLKTLKHRFNLATITLVPALVQGTFAPKSLVQALERAEKWCTPDVIILCRGGGSMEDLWCFNDETLVRAVFKCSIPCISAIGHETDFTLCDEVADARAATPTAAALLATPDQQLLLNRICHTRAWLTSSIQKHTQRRKIHHNRLKQGLLQCHPLQKLGAISNTRHALKQTLQQRLFALLQRTQHQTSCQNQRFIRQHSQLLSRLQHTTKLQQQLRQRLLHSLEHLHSHLHNRVNACTLSLKTLHPHNTLKRGYAIVQEHHTPITSINQLQQQRRITVVMQDGHFEAVVTKTYTKNSSKE